MKRGKIKKSIDNKKNSALTCIRFLNFVANVTLLDRKSSVSTSTLLDLGYRQAGPHARLKIHK